MTVESSRKSFVILAGVFGAAVSILCLIYSNLPDLPPEHRASIVLPRDIEDAKVSNTVHIPVYLYVLIVRNYLIIQIVCPTNKKCLYSGCKSDFQSCTNYFLCNHNQTNFQKLGQVISIYKETHYYSVMGLYFAAYIFLQTFAIPGSIFLSILSGNSYVKLIRLFA